MSNQNFDEEKLSIRSRTISEPLSTLPFMNRTTTMSDMLVIENFINGEFVPTNSHIDSIDPSTGSVWAKIPDSDETDINKAVDAAKKAFQK